MTLEVLESQVFKGSVVVMFGRLGSRVQSVVLTSSTLYKLFHFGEVK